MTLSRAMWVIGLLAATMAAQAFAQPVPPPPAAEEFNTATVQGRGTSNEAALQDALRNAVERGAAVFIHSQTKTENYEVVLDAVLSKATGFVKSYEPNPPKYPPPDINGIITITITAKVSVKEVTDDWGAIQLLLKAAGKPRCMVVIAEHVDGVRRENSTVASEIERLLVDKGFPVVDRNQFNEIQKKDIIAAKGEGEDLGKILAIGKQFGAEYFIIGSSQADFKNKEESRASPGIFLYYSGSSANAKMLRTENGDVVFNSGNVNNDRNAAQSRTAATDKALAAVGALLADKVQRDFVKHLIGRTAESQSIKLEISNITFDQQGDLTEALRKLPMVKGVQERPFANKVASYTLDIKGLAADFARALRRDKAMAAFKIEVTDVSSSSIKGKMTE